MFSVSAVNTIDKSTRPTTEQPLTTTVPALCHRARPHIYFGVFFDVFCLFLCCTLIPDNAAQYFLISELFITIAIPHVVALLCMF